MKVFSAPAIFSVVIARSAAAMTRASGSAASCARRGPAASGESVPRVVASAARTLQSRSLSSPESTGMNESASLRAIAACAAARIGGHGSSR